MKIRNQNIITDILYALTVTFGRHEAEMDCDGTSHTWDFGPLHFGCGVGYTQPELSCHGLNMYVGYGWGVEINPAIRWAIQAHKDYKRFVKRIKKFIHLTLISAKHLPKLMKYKGVVLAVLKANWITAKQ